MLERLLEIERGWFFAINSSHTWWLDHIMMAFTSLWAWFPLFFAFLFFIIKKPKGWALMFIVTALTSAITIFLTDVLIKPFFTRFRPTSHPSFMDDVRILNGYIADGAYGFISGHSASAFAFAVISALVIKNKLYSIFIFLWATIMVYSRVYLAAHFITDVIPGIITGTLVGLLLYMLYSFIYEKKY